MSSNMINLNHDKKEFIIFDQLENLDSHLSVRKLNNLMHLAVVLKTLVSELMLISLLQYL